MFSKASEAIPKWAPDTALGYSGVNQVYLPIHGRREGIQITIFDRYHEQISKANAMYPLGETVNSYYYEPV
jgi:hypothetical protein